MIAGIGPQSDGQILIDGKIVPMYRNVVAIDKPLPFNANVVQE